MIEIPDENLLGIFKAKSTRSQKKESDIVSKALSNPVGTDRLDALLGSDDKITIVITDASRPSIEWKVLPSMIEELRRANVRKENITILIGCGYHRPATTEEIKEKLGELFYKEFKVINHDAEAIDLVYLGETRKGIPIKVNRLVAEADFRIAIGSILPHPIAGFSGGPKTVAVGASGWETIAGTHTPEMLHHPRCGLGIVKGNPFYEACMEIAKTAEIDFILNSIVDEEEKIIHTVAGDVEEAHKKLVKVAENIFTVSVPDVTDVAVISVGYPKDSNLYHACVHGICTLVGAAVPKPLIKDGGILITVAPCQEGVYSNEFYRWLKDAKKLEDVLKRAKLEGIVKPGQHRAFGVAEILLNHKAIWAYTQVPPALVKELHMIPVADFNEGFEKAKKQFGDDAKFSVFINTHRMIPKLRRNAEMNLNIM